MKRLVCSCLALFICLSCLFFTNADFNETVDASTLQPDASDGVYYGLDANFSLVMNQSTSANITPNGAKVTTWSRTGHVSQLWDTYSTTFSGYTNADIIVANSNPHIALNINRTTYLATVYTLVGNYYRDCCLFSNYYKNSPYRDYFVYPRKSSETTTRALVGYPTSGQQFRWMSNTSGTLLYRNVWYEVDSALYLSGKYF